jgi:hypothetical protein
LAVLSPASLRLGLAQSPVAMGEFEYARFCREFERAATREILQHDPEY